MLGDALGVFGAPVGVWGAALGVLGAALGVFGAALGTVLGVLLGEFGSTFGGVVPGWVVLVPGVVLIPLGLVVAPGMVVPGVGGAVLGVWLWVPIVLWLPMLPPACPPPADCATAQAPHSKIVAVNIKILCFMFASPSMVPIARTPCRMENTQAEMPQQSAKSRVPCSSAATRHQP